MKKKDAVVEKEMRKMKQMNSISNNECVKNSMKYVILEVSVKIYNHVLYLIGYCVMFTL